MALSSTTSRSDSQQQQQQQQHKSTSPLDEKSFSIDCLLRTVGEASSSSSTEQTAAAKLLALNMLSACSEPTQQAHATPMGFAADTASQIMWAQQFALLNAALSNANASNNNNNDRLFNSPAALLATLTARHHQQQPLQLQRLPPLDMQQQQQQQQQLLAILAASGSAHATTAAVLNHNESVATTFPRSAQPWCSVSNTANKNSSIISTTNINNINGGSNSNIFTQRHQFPANIYHQQNHYGNFSAFFAAAAAAAAAGHNTPGGGGSITPAAQAAAAAAAVAQAFGLRHLHKRKGGQVRFTNEQTNDLERKFRSQKYLTPQERKKVAKGLNLTEKQIKTWFQNRRAKWRRLKKGEATPPPLGHEQEESDDDNEGDDEKSEPHNTNNLPHPFHANITAPHYQPPKGGVFHSGANGAGFISSSTSHHLPFLDYYDAAAAAASASSSSSATLYNAQLHAAACAAAVLQANCYKANLMTTASSMDVAPAATEEDKVNARNATSLVAPTFNCNSERSSL